VHSILEYHVRTVSYFCPCFAYKIKVVDIILAMTLAITQFL